MSREYDRESLKFSMKPRELIFFLVFSKLYEYTNLFFREINSLKVI